MDDKRLAQLIDLIGHATVIMACNLDGGPATATLTSDDHDALLAGLELLQKQRPKTLRSIALKSFGLNASEIRGYQHGYMLAIDKYAFRDDIGEPDEYGQQRALIVEPHIGDVINDWLEIAQIEDDNADLWEVIDLATGQTVRAGRFTQPPVFKTGDSVALPKDTGWGTTGIIAKLEGSRALVRVARGNQLNVRDYSIHELVKKEDQ